MKELLTNLEYQEIISVVWTVIILPILTYVGTQINAWAKAKKLDKYTNILKENITIAVKDVYTTYVDELKGTEAWTEETKAQALQMAKDKAIYALTDSAYRTLKLANEDFEEYLTTLIEAKLYDLKKK
jgi:hypothetical protein